ncbi:tetratricopeptide repeat protein [Magnetospirillum fulvum]|uniref:Uncharacterized protein n=1 Tax=Magnetospirillum fulvum MGU-K5 TaxID=1316936 RepID=S9TD97_MAGFU|nr:hypothetical protein [Magnetospirillum fulvum]EPY00191.1 hypothetical protein K678_17361 [Magnetospirillum fulvum MGU-K5]
MTGTSSSRFDIARRVFLDDSPDQAEAILAAADRLDPDEAELLARLRHNRAAAAFARGEPALAEAILRQALAVAPHLVPSRRGLADLLVLRARTHLDRAEIETAAALADEAGILAPGHAVQGTPRAEMAHRLHVAGIDLISRDPLLAARLAVTAWTLWPDGESHYSAARSLLVHLGTGELGAALETDTLESLLPRFPDDYVLPIALGNLERRAGHLHRAEHLYRLATARRPDLPFAPGRLAPLLAEQTRFLEADRMFQAIGRCHGGIERLIRLDPGFLATIRPMAAAVPDERAELDGNDGDIVVVAGGDSHYFLKYSDALVNSLAISGTRARLHFHIVDPTPAAFAQAERLRRRFPALPIEVGTESTPDHIAADRKRTYYACARFLHLPDLLRHHRRPVLMLDMDMVILRDVTQLVEQFLGEGKDIALIAGTQADPWCRLWADVILVRPTPAALDYLDTVRAYIRHFFDSGDAVWFLDQVALYCAFYAGYVGRPAPRLQVWPMDLQNASADLCYFWSLHSSQPTNQGVCQSALYQKYARWEGDVPPGNWIVLS